MNLREGIRKACKLRGTNISSLEIYVFGNPGGKGRLFAITNPNRTKNGPRLDTLQKIADCLDMKLSRLIELSEGEDNV